MTCLNKVSSENAIFRQCGCVQISGKIHKPASIYLFRFNNKNGGKRYKICLKLTIKTI